MADIIEVITQEHRQVEQLFQQYQTEADKASIGQLIVEHLELHTKLEEQLVYPQARHLSLGEEAVDHAQEEHDEAKQLIAKFREDFSDTAVAQQLQTSIEHHVQEEESEMLRAMKNEWDEEKRHGLAVQWEQAKNLPSK